MSNIVKTEAPAYSGNLTINVTSSQGLIPIQNATITISYTREPDAVVTTLTTNESGQTETIALPAPSINYSERSAALLRVQHYRHGVRL